MSRVTLVEFSRTPGDTDRRGTLTLSPERSTVHVSWFLDAEGRPGVTVEGGALSSSELWRRANTELDMALVDHKLREPKRLAGRKSGAVRRRRGNTLWRDVIEQRRADPAAGPAQLAARLFSRHGTVRASGDRLRAQKALAKRIERLLK